MVWNRLAVLSALMSVTTCVAAQEPAPATAAIEWELDYATALERGRNENKPVLIDFYADWCGPCRMMEAQVFTDPRVVQASNLFVPVKVDVDRNEAVAFAYRIRSIPRTVVLNVYGEMVGDRIGFLDADEYLKFLHEVQEFTHTKVGGMVVNVPESVPEGETQTLVAVNAETGWDELADLFSHPDPQVREAARQELQRRDPAEVKQFLDSALQDPYLGTRIAAWETLLESSSESTADYDPWKDPADGETTDGSEIRR